MVRKKGGLIQLDYDVVIVGDVEPDSFLWHPEYWDWLEAWVKQGGGLILISGSAHNPRDYVNCESFRKLCPISLDFPDGYESAVNSNIIKHLARTRQGRDHELFNLASDESRRDELLGSEIEGRFRPGALHGLYWYQVTGGAVKGATVLARVAREGGSVAEGEPVVVTQEYGEGRVLYLGTDDFHYWREFVGDYYFYKFWQNAVRWAANDPGE